MPRRRTQSGPGTTKQSLGDGDGGRPSWAVTTDITAARACRLRTAASQLLSGTLAPR